VSGASSQGITFINADMGTATSLRVVGSRIESVGGDPQRDDIVIDLGGDRLLPGLINAHDHLHLNNLGRLKYREQHANVREWIEDVAAHVQSSVTLRTASRRARDERLLQGALKNVLCGVTTVAHHDRLYEYLLDERCPISALKYYGWSHSLQIDGEEQVRLVYRQTPVAWPWIIHAAEGIDAEAAAEFERLDALGCIGSNTLLVHGIAMDESQHARLIEAGAGLIWCPASNLHIFGASPAVGSLVRHGRVALGTDSRLSGSHDLLSELGTAREVSGLDESTLESLVTDSSARLLRLGDRGVLRAGARADLLVIPKKPLSSATRTDIRLVMVRGRMLYADMDYARSMDPSTSSWVPVSVDGRPKAMQRRLAEQVLESDVQEAGVDVGQATWRAA
jgi:cytosine/adenosine deaminase-related metal-dependent hydrolase